jgi:hypothetical protein
MPVPIVIEKVMGTADVAQWFVWVTPELHDWLSDVDSDGGPDLEPWNACTATDWALTERGLIKVTVAEFVELCKATGVPMTEAVSDQASASKTSA